VERGIDMLTSVLIDVDGTLINTKNIFYSSLNKTLKKYNIPETNDPTLFGMSVDQALGKLKIGYNIKLKDDWELLFSEMSIEAGFYDGIIEMAKTLDSKGVKIVIITSRGHSTADPICDDSELSPYISGCIAAEDTKEHKPNPAPILKAIIDYEIDVEKTLYIGDTLQDYQAASAASIPFAWAGWNSDVNVDEGFMVFHNPLDVVHLI
jgi:HAD superfamily hydrolase (TIGR01549 family)